MARYIDADKLIAHLKDEIDACEPIFGGRANGKSVAYGTELGLKAAISFAKTLSVADVVPKSEGEWVDQYNGKYDNPIYVCSLCRKGTPLKPEIDNLGNMKMIQALSPFCPNCGAKMKGGEADA